eukprot:CAMPEP_0201258812 /NCGR_PEP_ID=MMETSP0853-20130426/3124_1 /ASSEMBLY_ACC=CAM_ASM_000640 /TAXON_ID=183588 /ORGANISM="Pseudo-nitzschia fraudulenta, Strain WWA7" /LENGTH=105 /DNA_ID=CAMNT_0047560577 /DNA_START=290 /DNA_END=607 /DNA_ORIENTATION=-
MGLSFADAATPTTIGGFLLGLDRGLLSMLLTEQTMFTSSSLVALPMSVKATCFAVFSCLVFFSLEEARICRELRTPLATILDSPLKPPLDRQDLDASLAIELVWV